MTIAAGFLCSDGVVLAADTQYTSNIKQHGLKVWEITGPDMAYSIAMAGAGDAVLIHALRDRLRMMMEPSGILGIRPLEVPAFMGALGIRGSQMSVETVAADLQKLFLKPFHDENVSSYPNWQDTRPLQFLLAIRVGNQAALYQNSAATLGRVEPMACIGSGSELGGFLQETLFTSDMTTQTARRIAAHLVKQAKHYSPWCGGETTILTIPNSGARPVMASKKEVRADEIWMQKHLKFSLTDQARPESDE